MELERHAAELLAHTVSEDDRRRIAHEARQAAAVRELLDERRRQAREVTALNASSRRLSSLHGIDELLHEVAAQSRFLLGVDIAYIMVRQDDGTLRIEAADGSMGSALRGIALAEGEGVGGEVMRTGEPMWSEAYLQDQRLHRVGHADAAAENEQLGGILAVPLQVDGETLGVLCAAERRPRRFAAREVEVLAALAAHAAVALRNAQLFEQRQGALNELRATNESLRSLDDRRQRAIELREDLTGAVIAGGGVAELATAMSRALRRPVEVLDAVGEVITTTTSDVNRSSLTSDVRPDDTWFETARTVRWQGQKHALVLASVVLREEHVGCLITTFDEKMPPEEADEIERLLGIGATSVALVMAMERAVAEAELRTRGELLNALLTADIDVASVERRARAAGIDLGSIKSVTVLDPGRTGDETPVVRLGSRLAVDLDGWSLEHSGQVVVMLPIGDAELVRTRLVTLAGERGPIPSGIANCGPGVEGIRRAHVAARQTAMLLHALGLTQAVARADEMGIYRALFSSAGRGELAAFVEATLGSLLRLDRDKGRDLAHTLGVYLAHAQHHARTCSELHIHANTLYNRLDRITEALGDDWRSPQRTLELQLALRMQDLITKIVSGTST